jgi:hypothetical protein
VKGFFFFLLFLLLLLLLWFYSLVEALTLSNYERQQFENSSFGVSHRVDWYIVNNVLEELPPSTVSKVPVQ